jgi:hypothetical protein
MLKIVEWFIISLFLFLFVNQIYVYLKQSNIKEGLTNDDTKQISINSNNIEKVNNELNEIKKIINKTKDIQQDNNNEIKINNKKIKDASNI